jgi:hypothetical protein
MHIADRLAGVVVDSSCATGIEPEVPDRTNRRRVVPPVWLVAAFQWRSLHLEPDDWPEQFETATQADLGE